MANIPDVKDLESSRTMSFLTGNKSAVDVAKIEKELASLWKSARDGEETGDLPISDHVVRACVLNFCILIRDGRRGDQQRVEAMNDLLTGLSLRHPARVILGLVNEADDDSGENYKDLEEKVDAWVSARCHLLPGAKDKQVCCEQITVETTYKHGVGDSLASVINPLIVPDLPAFLYLSGFHLDAALIKPFLGYFQRVVFELADNLEDDLDLAMAQTTSCVPAIFALSSEHYVHDLSWSLIKPYRMALAQTFDDDDVAIDPAMLQEIIDIELVTSDIAQGALYLAWLADRLNLSPLSTMIDKAKSAYEITMAGDRQINARIVYSALEQGQGIKSVRLRFAPDQDQGQDQDTGLLVEAESRVIKSCYKGTTEYLELPMDDPRESAIDQILTSKKTDPFYLRALGIMAAFNKKEKKQ